MIINILNELNEARVHADKAYIHAKEVFGENAKETEACLEIWVILDNVITKVFHGE